VGWNDLLLGKIDLDIGYRFIKMKFKEEVWIKMVKNVCYLGFCWLNYFIFYQLTLIQGLMIEN